MRFHILDWDSNFFGIKVARIEQPELDEQELSETLSELRDKKVKFAYWPSSRELEPSSMSKLNGLLADRKTTFVVDLLSLDDSRIAPSDHVETFVDTMPATDLENLAIQSGEYSRFAVDPNLPKEKFISLYKTWIHRSISKEIASEILVIRNEDKVVAMVTLGEKNGRGDIGLMAVDANHRGKGYGEKLVRAAQTRFKMHGYRYGQVVTQGANKQACGLYSKCDYLVERVEYFYHFWL